MLFGYKIGEIGEILKNLFMCSHKNIKIECKSQIFIDLVKISD